MDKTEPRNLPLQRVAPPRLAPAYLTSVSRRKYLHYLVNQLPQTLQDKITVLKNIQLEYLNLEAEFYHEVHSLEMKYQSKFQPLLDKRRDIITGKVEPPKEEPKWNTSHDLKLNGLDKEIEFYQEVQNTFENIPAEAKGFPNFWFTVFKNTNILAEMIKDHDEPLLKKLSDIGITYGNDDSFTLEFVFEKNDYFSNPVLTKQYFLRTTVDDEGPFAFDGLEIYRSKGCKIKWYDNKNLTVRGGYDTKDKEKDFDYGLGQNETFFNFFNVPEINYNKEDLDKDLQDVLETDFGIGHFIRDRIIPKAVLYLTGDVVDDESDDDGDNYTDESSEVDEDEDDSVGESGRGSKKSEHNNKTY